MRVRLSMLLGVCLLLLGCGSSVKNAIHPAPAGPRASAYDEQYRIQPGDTLDIKFFYSPELNEQVPVRPDGRISLQLSGEVMAAGKTPAELTEMLKEIYGKELKKPDVTVIVRTFGNQRVYVDGEVNRPGLVPLTGPTTLLQAISQAGGIKETGGASEVVVIRRYYENKPEILVVNTDNILNGTDLDGDIYMKPFDIVHVPRTGIANVNLWIDQYMNRLIPRIGFFFSRPWNGGQIGYETTTR